MICSFSLIASGSHQLWEKKSIYPDSTNYDVREDKNLKDENHISTLVRRSKNQISAIKNNVGEWLHEERDIMEHIRGGFEGLFYSSIALSQRNPPSLFQGQASFSEDECESFSIEITEEEIKTAFWSMKPFKALRPDGLHASFYQRFWSVVWKSLVEEIKEIFSKKKIQNISIEPLLPLFLRFKALKP